MSSVTVSRTEPRDVHDEPDPICPFCRFRAIGKSDRAADARGVRLCERPLTVTDDIITAVASYLVDLLPMPAEKEDRGPFCAVCGDVVKPDEDHYRAGVAWFHIGCYEKAEKRGPRKKPHQE